MIANEETCESIDRGDSDLDSNYSSNTHFAKALDLSRKNLRELPQNMLKEYKSLKCLYLEKNLLRELPDEMFHELPFLSWLDVRNNRLSDFPKSVANHRALEVILLQGNKLQSLPLELGLVPKLRGLQISGNPLFFPPEDIIRQGITSILSYLRDECRTCSIYTKEGTNDDLQFPNADNTIENASLVTESLQGGHNHMPNIKMNTTRCITNCQLMPKVTNKDSTTGTDCSAEQQNQISSTSKKDIPGCKSSIRVMTNPKPSSIKVRNSAPVLPRLKTGMAPGRKSTTKTAASSKNALMRQNNIIQRRKSEEALKSWRDQMRSMKEKSGTLKQCVPTKEKFFPYGTDNEYMKMPTREMLQNLSQEVKKQSQSNSNKSNSPAINIGDEISLIFESLQSLKCTKDIELSSPRTQQKAAKDKLSKVNELNSAIGDLKKKILTKGPS